LSTNGPNSDLIYKGTTVTIEIDPHAGFCFGVDRAVHLAESLLQKDSQAYCVGDIVHNQKEMDRLSQLGLTFVNHQELENQTSKKVLFRAHGEPPQSYQLANQKQHQLTDATCPVVVKLQQRVKKAWETMINLNGQVIIFGKRNHAEVLGLVGQTQNQAVVIENMNDLDAIDFSRPIEVFSQTTSSLTDYKLFCERITSKAQSTLKINDTICRQVSSREPWLKAFVITVEVMIFVGGTKSSNAKFLHGVCKSHNPDSFLVSGVDDIQMEWFAGKTRVGISGATSTPLWQLQEVAQWLHQNLNEQIKN